MDAEPPIVVDRYGAVTLVSLNRPKVRNAVNAELSAMLGDALQEGDDDPSVRAIVLTGRGPAFCSGADLRGRAAGRSNLPQGREAWGFGGVVTHEIATPLIAAVNGPCLGGGTEIVLSCDLVVASEEASFGLPEVRRGIIAGAGGLVRLPQCIPPRVALHMAMTGESISAHDAERFGLVNLVVPPEELVRAALELAERISHNAPLAVKASKSLVRGVAYSRLPDEDSQWKAMLRERADVAASEDAQEGSRAFVERRPPSWKGR